jgi:amino acid transporter
VLELLLLTTLLLVRVVGEKRISDGEGRMESEVSTASTVATTTISTAAAPTPTTAAIVTATATATTVTTTAATVAVVVVYDVLQCQKRSLHRSERRKTFRGATHTPTLLLLLLLIEGCVDGVGVGGCTTHSEKRLGVEAQQLTDNVPRLKHQVALSVVPVVVVVVVVVVFGDELIR